MVCALRVYGIFCLSRMIGICALCVHASFVLCGWLVDLSLLLVLSFSCLFEVVRGSCP